MLASTGSNELAKLPDRGPKSVKSFDCNISLHRHPTLTLFQYKPK